MKPKNLNLIETEIKHIQLEPELNKQKLFVDYLKKEVQKVSQSSTRFRLVGLSDDLAKSIFECNLGSVKDYFIDFSNIDQVYDWIGEYKGLMEKGIKIEFVIEHKVNSELIGMVALDKLNTEKALIRMWINPLYQKQGYAKEACGYIITAFKNLYPVKSIIYTAETKNIASVNLAKSLGFVFTKNFIDEDGLESVELVI